MREQQVASPLNDSAGGRDLLFFSFPHQLLHGLAALAFDRTIRGVPESAPATALVWSHRLSDHRGNSSDREIYKRAMRSFPFVDLIIPSWVARAGPLAPYRRIEKRAAAFLRLFPSQSFENFFYSHDASADHTAQAIMQALPEARPVCYGDPPGFLYPAGYSDSWPGESAGNRLKNLLWRSRFRTVTDWKIAELSLLVLDFRLPTDPLGSAVRQIPRRIVLAILERLRSAFPYLAEEEASLLDLSRKQGRRASFLLLSNLTESGLTTRENETRLYEDICREHLTRGDILYVKPHPAGSSDSFERLSNNLRGFTLRQLPETMRKLPIEFCAESLATNRVLSVSSSSALLRHLYGSDVVHALPQERVRRYFRPEHVAEGLVTSRRIEQVMAAAEGVSSGPRRPAR